MSADNLVEFRNNIERYMFKVSYDPRELRKLGNDRTNWSIAGINPSGFLTTYIDAKYNGETDEFEFDGIGSPDIVFVIRSSPTKISPELIARLINENQSGQELMELANLRAKQHNFHRALTHLRRGGSWDTLVPTDLLPSMRQVLSFKD